MNWWSFLYLCSFFFFLSVGVYGWKLNKRALLNNIFLKSSIELSLWSLGCGMMLIAKNAHEAMIWRTIFLVGACFVYTNILMGTLVLSNYEWTRKNLKYSPILLVLPLLVVIHYADPSLGKFVMTSSGWNFVIVEQRPVLYIPSMLLSLHYYDPRLSEFVLSFKEFFALFTKHSFWLLFYNSYYYGYILVSILLLIKWKQKTESIREKKQAKALLQLFFWTTILRMMTDIGLPFWRISWVGFLFSDMLYAIITQLGVMFINIKYKMMNLTQEIVANHVLQTMMEPVLIMNNELVIKEINPITTLIIGYSRTELLGVKLQKLVDIQESWQDFLSELAMHNYANAEQLNFTTKAGDKIYLRGSAVNLFGEYQEQLGSVLVLHDITEQKLHEDLIKEAHQELELKIFKLRHVFNSIDQGILTFGRNLLIQVDYSLECERIFGEDLADQSLAGLLYPNDLQLQEFTNKLLRKLFELDESQTELYLPLLPEQMLIGEKTISLKYKLVKKETVEIMMMVLITDITDKLELERRMDQERKILKMVVKVILNRDAFMSLVQDYQVFRTEITNEAIEMNYETLLRQIHTFKGSFSQYYLINLVEKLDQLESELMREESLLALYFMEQDALQLWLQVDLEIIEIYVGKEFFAAKEGFYLEKERLDWLEQKISSSLRPSQTKMILPWIKSLSYKSLHELLGSYPDYTLKLSERLGKEIKPFKIKGDLVFVDEQDYRELCRVLGHLFRNAVDHGIETIEERVVKGKTQWGEIFCEIKELPTQLQIVITDDGRGINTEILRQKALDKGLVSEEKMLTLSETEQLQIIFLDRMTSMERTTMISGRGVGLAAVKESVVALGGEILVESQLGQGTKFIITLPKKCLKEQKSLTVVRWMEEIAATSKQLMWEQVGICFENTINEVVEKLDFYEMTALINIKGVLDGLVIFSFNQDLVDHLFEKTILYQVSETEKADYFDDLTREITNTILGNALARFEEMNCFLEIGLPTILCNRNGYLKNSNFQIRSALLIGKEARMKISILLLDGETEIEEVNEMVNEKGF